MKFILICLIMVLSSCTPWKSDPVTDDQVSLLERSQAIKDWKCSEGRTDECSSPAPVHWLANTFLEKNWPDCCEQHDFDYNFGWKYGIRKNQADYALWACVVDSGHPFVANLIYDAVHVFGSKYYHEN
jgi:hypothetical protein